MGCAQSAPSSAAVSPSPNVRPPPPTEEEKEDAYMSKLKQKLKMADEMKREGEASLSEYESAQNRAK
jgi:hypothetical protein